MDEVRCDAAATVVAAAAGTSNATNIDQASPGHSLEEINTKATESGAAFGSIGEARVGGAVICTSPVPDSLSSSSDSKISQKGTSDTEPHSQQLCNGHQKSYDQPNQNPTDVKNGYPQQNQLQDSVLPLAKQTLEGKPADTFGQQGLPKLPLSQQEMDDSQRQVKIYIDQKRKVQEKGYLSAFHFIPSPDRSHVQASDVEEPRSPTSFVEKFKLSTETITAITYSKNTIGPISSSPNLDESKKLGKVPRAGSKVTMLFDDQNDSSSTYQSKGTDDNRIPGVTYSKKSTGSIRSKSKKRGRGQRTRSRSRTNLPDMMPSTESSSDESDDDDELYYTPAQLISNEIDTIPGLAFQDNDSDNDTQTIKSADRFLDRAYVNKWRPTRGRKNKKGRNSKGGKVSRYPISDKYSARLTFAGVSVNLGSDHYTSTGAAAALDIANKLYYGRENEKAYNVLSESEVTKTLDTIGYNEAELDKFQFKNNFGEEKKKKLEQAVDLALSCIGGRDDNLAEILCDIETMSDVHNASSKKVKDTSTKMKKQARIDPSSKTENKNKGDNENFGCKRLGQHVVYLVNEKGKFTFDLDNSIKFAGDSKGH